MPFSTFSVGILNLTIGNLTTSLKNSTAYSLVKLAYRLHTQLVLQQKDPENKQKHLLYFYF